MKISVWHGEVKKYPNLSDVINEWSIKTKSLRYIIITNSMMVNLGILIGAVLDRDGVGLQRVLGLDSDEQRRSTSRGNQLSREEGGLEAASKSSLQLF